jgi:hypothetical protein
MLFLSKRYLCVSDKDNIFLKVVLNLFLFPKCLLEWIATSSFERAKHSVRQNVAVAIERHLQHRIWRVSA